MENAFLTVKVVSLDYYLSRPDRHLCRPLFALDAPHGKVARLLTLGRAAVPVVRVFGVTHGGQHVCVHLHGAFPYLYVPVDASHVDEVTSTIQDEIYDQHTSLEERYASLFQKALDGAMGIHQNGACKEGPGKIVDVQLVKGTPFYGYQKDECLWMKVYVFDPADVKRCASLLHSGAILGKKFQPHESHIPFLLQVKIDYNLYGMGWMALEKAIFRSPIQSKLEIEEGKQKKHGGWIHRKVLGPSGDVWKDASQIWCRETVDAGNIADVKKQTTCELECDALVGNILNVCEKKRVDITTADMELQLVDSLGPIWEEERKRQGKHDISPSPPDICRNVDQIDPDTVNMWREKFRDADRQRRLKDATTLATDPSLFPSANDILWSQLDKVKDVAEDNQFDNDISSLVDIGLVEANRNATLNVLDDWGDRQRELGHLSQRELQETDDHLMELAAILPKSHGDENALDLFMISQEMSSQLEIGKMAETALMQDTKTVENECRDIIEASQHFDNVYENDELIPQVDGADDDSEGGSGRTTADKKKKKRRLSTSYIPRERMREAGLMLSQIKEMFFGPSNNTLEKAEPSQPTPILAQQSQPDIKVNSQDVVDFWSEPASQCIMDDFEPFGDDMHTEDVANIFEPIEKPLSKSEVENSWEEEGLLPIVHQGPHFSRAADMGKRHQVFGGRIFHLKTTATESLPLFSPSNHMMQKLETCNGADDDILLYQNPEDPPSYAQVKAWVEAHSTQDSGKCVSFNENGAIMDSNTGKMLPSGGMLSHQSLIGTPTLPSYNQNNSKTPCLESAEQGVVSHGGFRPASPKYDEAEDAYRDLPSLDVNDVSRGPKTQKFHMHAAEKSRVPRKSISQISAPTGSYGDVTPESQLGFKITSTKGEGLTLVGIEVHAECRQGLLPDPQYDRVHAIVLSVFDDDEIVISGQYYTRILMVKQHQKSFPNFEGISNVQFDFVDSEKDLFSLFESSIRFLDPDILVGFEIQKDSLGYLADRSISIFENNSFLSDLSRVPTEKRPLDEMIEHDQYGWQHDSGLHVTGRIVLNIWRIVRAEVKLASYSFENCVASILKLRVPCIKKGQLHAWFSKNHTRWRCLSHIILRTRLCIHMLEQLNFIGRTAELARTFGIDFFSVISRGSQYRVESMMVRLAHSQNYIVLSPNNEQVARQPAMEALPLVMEPESGMYEDPVCVLDFQSLYPSMIIAYNLCFSTCVGRPSHVFSEAEDQTRLGCKDTFQINSCFSEIGMEASDLIVAPNGVGFVPPFVRKGVLPRLLHEILQTRIMIKKTMRDTSSDMRPILRALNAKQFALKLIANVTYGYTAAGFSGRMPMAELADAIVQSGRATLESTIKFIREHPSWNADVIYGDTDSIFVRLPGRSVAQAHAIGQEIATAVTSRNPDPVLLKLEKVYRPCFLLSKKRYVGAMYESSAQMKFQFDAKGIETVRRDSCPAVAKIVEQALRILFTSADVSLVRNYVERQWKRIISGRVSIKDFIFSKEVRLGTYSTTSASSIPPAALVATKAMARDPRAEPRFGERVSYVVVHGEPGARLIDMVVPPEALVESGGQLRLHSIYYITKQIIPALERFLRLIGVDIRMWFSQLPKLYRNLPHKRPLSTLPILDDKPVSSTRTHTIDKFYLSRHCVCCDGLTMVKKPLCTACEKNPQLVAAVLPSRLNRIERQYVHIGRICTTCGGGSGSQGTIACESLDCGIYFERIKVQNERHTALALVHMAQDLE